MEYKSFNDAPEYHHAVILANKEGGQMGVGLSDEDGNIRGVVFMDVAQANNFGQAWCDKFNAVLAAAKERQP